MTTLDDKLTEYEAQRAIVDAVVTGVATVPPATAPDMVEALEAVVDVHRDELAAADGAELVGNGAETVADSFNALQLADYTALRAYAGPRKSVYVTGYLLSTAPSGIAGMFVRDDSDTTTADNGGTVIVASNGKRWKRELKAGVTLEYFGGGVNASAAANNAAFTAAFAAHDHVQLGSAGTYSYSVGLVLLGKKLTSVAGVRATTLYYDNGVGAAITVGGSDATSAELSGFVLLGTNTADAGLRLAYAGTGCRNGDFRNIHVSGFTKTGAIGVELAGSLNNGIYYNYFQNVRSYSNYLGWKIWSTDGAANGNRANSNNFVNCTAQYNVSDGWLFDWATNNSMYGCDREANGGFGINTDHVLDLTVFAGYSESNTAGGVNKTANGNLRLISRVIDGVTGTALSGDLFLVNATGLAVDKDGGIGVGGNAPVKNGINFDNGSDALIKLSGTTYLTFDHTNGMNLATRAIRKNGVAKSSAAGALSLAGVVTEYVEVTLTENITGITFPTAVDGYEFEIIFTQAAGSYTVAGWPSVGAGSVLLAGGTFTMTATSGKRDRLRFRYHADYARWIETGRTQNL